MRAYLNLARHEGNNPLFEAVEMAVLSTLWDVPLHLHAEGLRGTGKTTIMRAAQEILPPITRIKNCLYNCDPEQPHCPEHRHLTEEELTAIGIEVVPRPFLEISHSAKIGTIAGSIDLAKITNTANPLAAILPGIIPQAHRGIIFIDEINRLADTSPEITDVLLDVMGTKPGRVQIEETGLPVVEIPVEVSVWAASNPDEEPGPLQDIRRQLSDRFDLAIDMGRAKDEDAVSAILAGTERVRKKKSKFKDINLVSPESIQYSERLQALADKYSLLSMPDYLRNYIARIYVKYNLESLRAVEAVQHGALLSCALRDGGQVLVSDVLKVLPLALQHRVDLGILAKILGGDNLNLNKVTSQATGGYNSKYSGGTGGGNDSSGDSSQVASKSFLDPLKQMLSGKSSSPVARDEITAAPAAKARRIPEVSTEELIKTENDFSKEAL